jgi:3-hydroxy-9,10-secoandrosta-1,3,5(10)-triene-9,17-dione monooxygenase reductase component
VTSESVSTDPAVFRQVLGRFATGVTVVTAIDGAEPVGFTCQAFLSLSLDPSLVAIAPSLASTSWPRIARAGRFCVNVLAASEGELARRFAVSGGSKFEGVDWSMSQNECPVLAGVLAFVDCSLAAVHDAGDHVIAIGKVLDLGVAEEEHAGAGPLLFYRGQFGSFEAHSRQP